MIAETRTNQIVSLTQELIRIQSFSGQEGEAAALVHENMSSLGYDEVQVDKFGNVIGRMTGQKDRANGKILLFDGHLDTVAPVQLENWTVDPFAGTLMENRVYGLGAVDMKGSLAAMILAVAGVPRNRFSGTIFVSASVGEEILEGAALASVVEITKPDYVVIGEPTDFRIGTAQRGRAGLVVDTLGVAAHTAQPELGENAVYKMTEVINRLRRMDLPTDNVLGLGLVELIDIISSPFPSTSVVPSGCRARFDRRLVRYETPESVLIDITENLRDIQGVEVHLNEESLTCYTGHTLEDIDFHPAWAIPLENELVVRTQSALREMGMDVDPIMITYCSNASYSAGTMAIPTIIFGPPSIKRAHAVDEYIEVQDLYHAVNCYQTIASSLLGNEME
ncbi:MAG: YgeY family selenium metabolism-linked hydrolase [Chloroflexi bacterium]|nr:YgeY family selenium metabolism-linked hydrolase [Chloroflexota bacterium]